MVSGWKEATLEELCVANGLVRGPFGGALKKEIFVATGYKVYEQRNAIYATTEMGNYYITDEKFRELFRFAIADGDFIVSCSGTIGCIYRLPSNAPKGVINQALLKISIDNEKIDAELFHQYFRSDPFQKSIIDDTQGGAMKNLIGMDKFRKALFFLPSDMKEQRAIAAALSDADAYIAALERLITKKRNIKKGATQELLTGKRRLPGFEGDWEEIKFSDVCQISSSLVDPRLDEYKLLPHIGNENIEKSTGKLLPYRTAQEDSLISGKYLFSENDVLYGKINPQFAKACFPKFSGVCSADMYPLTTKPGFSPSFLLYVILSEHFTTYTISVSMRSGMPKVNREELYAYECLMPTLAEQNAIATILSDMDAEIDALMLKLNKAKYIKQGMMQELLTGRIRLVGEEAEAAPVEKPATKVIEIPKREPQSVVAQTSGHNQQFDDAVMIAGIVNALYSDKFPLGRKKVQKCLYLLRRYQDESTASFKKKAAGPYADEVRYKGGEPIARSAKYIVTTATKDIGTTFARGGNISQALGYIQSWGRQADIKWLTDKLKFKKVDELELLATVDMAICDLEEVCTPVSVATIKHLIATNAEWKAKLKKQSFSDANIAMAIKELQTLLQGGN